MLAFLRRWWKETGTPKLKCNRVGHNWKVTASWRSLDSVVYNEVIEIQCKRCGRFPTYHLTGRTVAVELRSFSNPAPAAKGR